MLEVQQLTYRYPEQNTAALAGISARIEPGQRIALIGANGAGKSTLCLALAGFIPHFLHGTLEGCVRLHGAACHDTPLAEWVQQVGLMLQHPAQQLSGCAMRVDEEIAFGLENRGLPSAEIQHRVTQVMARTGLDALAASHPNALSGGQQQRLALASMLVLEPPLLILDEPFAQLDPASRSALLPLLDELHKTGTTLIIAEQNLDFVAAWADQVLLLDRGQLRLTGSPRAVLYAEALMQAGLEPPAMVALGRRATARRLWPLQYPLPLTLDEACQGLSALAPGAV